MSSQEKDLDIDIIWDSVSVADWKKYFFAIEKTNIIQTAAYAKAIRNVKYQMTRFGVIYHAGQVIGILQIQEIKLLGFLHFVFLDRGPLWLIDVNDDIVEKFFLKFKQLFPRRLGRIRRIIPELEDNLQNTQILTRCGFKKKMQGYRSIWLNLTNDIEVLRANLKGKWRNALNKAEKSDLVVSEIPVLIGLDLLLHRYMQDRLKKNYAGASPKVIKSLVKYADDITYPLLLNISYRGKDIAMGLFFLHGKSATYQIGWASDLGRKKNAHNLMLWQAIKILKDKNIKYLDLGGINPDIAEGVTKFKKSMGGEEYNLIGLYS